MLLGSSNQTWVQSIKNRMLKNITITDVLLSEGSKALIYHMPKDGPFN